MPVTECKCLGAQTSLLLEALAVKAKGHICGRNGGPCGGGQAGVHRYERRAPRERGLAEPLRGCHSERKGRFVKPLVLGGSQQAARGCGHYTKMMGSLLPSVQLEGPRDFPKPASRGSSLGGRTWGGGGCWAWPSRCPRLHGPWSAQLPATRVRKACP